MQRNDGLRRRAWPLLHEENLSQTDLLPPLHRHAMGIDRTGICLRRYVSFDVSRPTQKCPTRFVWSPLGGLGRQQHFIIIIGEESLQSTLLPRKYKHNTTVLCHIFPPYFTVALADIFRHKYRSEAAVFRCVNRPVCIICS